jgi:FAD synthase
LRPEKKFPTEALLKTAIKKDVQSAQNYYQKGVV